jgi:hypothetical protein
VDGWMKVQHKVKINKVRIWIRWFVKINPEGFDDPGLRVSSLFKDVDVFVPSQSKLVKVRIVVEDVVESTDN